MCFNHHPCNQIISIAKLHNSHDGHKNTVAGKNTWGNGKKLVSENSAKLEYCQLWKKHWSNLLSSKNIYLFIFVLLMCLAYFLSRASKLKDMFAYPTDMHSYSINRVWYIVWMQVLTKLPGIHKPKLRLCNKLIANRQGKECNLKTLRISCFQLQ